MSGVECLMPNRQASNSNGLPADDFLIWKEYVCEIVRSGRHYAEKNAGYEPTLSIIEDDSITNDFYDRTQSHSVRQDISREASQYILSWSRWLKTPLLPRPPSHHVEMDPNQCMELQ